MNKLHDRLIKEALDHEENLTQWEIEFLDSLAKQVEKRELSEKQAKILNKINQKAVFG